MSNNISLIQLVGMLFFLPLFICGQEQVSNIENLSVHELTRLQNEMGFALVDKQQYLIVDKDSLSFYKLEDGQFKIFNTLVGLPDKYRPFYPDNTIQLNRSQFQIFDDKYFRLFKEGFSIVDIAKGSIDKTIVYSDYNISRGVATLVIENRVYIKDYTDGLTKIQIYDIKADELTLVREKTYDKWAQIGDYIADFNQEGNVIFYDGRNPSGFSTLKLESGYAKHFISREDSTIVFVENDGSVSKIRKGTIIEKLDCVIQNIQDLDGYSIRGDRLFTASWREVFDDQNQFIVTVTNLLTCEEELIFRTAEIDSFANHFWLVENENPGESFTILGIAGGHPSDGTNPGLFYFIDHRTNDYNEIGRPSGCVSGTPFVKNDTLYLVSVNSSNWGYSSSLLEYDINSATSNFHTPQYGNIAIVLGYHDEDLFLMSNEAAQRHQFNDIIDKPTIWSFDGADFIETQSFSYKIDIGVDYLSDVVSHKDRLYFACTKGLYSSLSITRLESIFAVNEYSVDPNFDMSIAVYNDEIAVVEKSDSGAVFKVLDTASGVVDSLATDGRISGDFNIGPYIVYNTSGDVPYFDIRSRSFGVFDSLKNVSERRSAVSKDKAVFLSKRMFSSNTQDVVIVDIPSSNFSKPGIRLSKSAYVKSGYDDSFYLIDEDSFSGMRVLLLRNDGTLDSIYSGGDSHFLDNTSYDHSAIVRTMEFRSTENMTTELVSNNLEETERLAVQRGGTGSVIDNQNNGKFILKEIVSGEMSLSFYEPFVRHEQIVIPSGHSIRLTDVNDSLAVVLFSARDSINKIVTYDYENNLNRTIDAPCHSVARAFALSNSEYFLSAKSCDSEHGYEPMLLDLESGSLELLLDIRKGVESSSPGNFTAHMEWVYFTAITDDSTKQWFRYPRTLGISQIEEVISEDLSINIYPSPSHSVINTSVPLKSYTIYNIEGIVVQSVLAYNKQQIDISAFLDGVYSIIGYDEKNKIRTGRFVKVHD